MIVSFLLFPSLMGSGLARQTWVSTALMVMLGIKDWFSVLVWFFNISYSWRLERLSRTSPPLTAELSLLYLSPLESFERKLWRIKIGRRVGRHAQTTVREASMTVQIKTGEVRSRIGQSNYKPRCRVADWSSLTGNIRKTRLKLVSNLEKDNKTDNTTSTSSVTLLNLFYNEAKPRSPTSSREGTCQWQPAFVSMAVGGPISSALASRERRSPWWCPL